MTTTPARQALQMHLSRITTVDHNGLTRSLWAKQQQSGRRPTSVCHNLLTFATDGGFFCRDGVQAVALPFWSCGIRLFHTVCAGSIPARGFPVVKDQPPGEA